MKIFVFALAIAFVVHVRFSPLTVMFRVHAIEAMNTHQTNLTGKRFRLVVYEISKEFRIEPTSPVRLIDNSAVTRIED